MEQEQDRGPILGTITLTATIYAGGVGAQCDLNVSHCTGRAVGEALGGMLTTLLDTMRASANQLSSGGFPADAGELVAQFMAATLEHRPSNLVESTLRTQKDQ